MNLLVSYSVADTPGVTDELRRANQAPVLFHDDPLSSTESQLKVLNRDKDEGIQVPSWEACMLTSRSSGPTILNSLSLVSSFLDGGTPLGSSNTNAISNIANELKVI